MDEGRIETVEAGGHGGVGGEEVSGAGDGECDVEGLAVVVHEIAGALQDGERGVAFIQVTDFWFDSEFAE